MDQAERITIPGAAEEIPALLWGPASDRWIIAVHGNFSHKADRVIALLARRAAEKGYRTLSFDLPQHGERAGGALPLDPPSCVGDLGAVYEYVRPRAERTALFGCSLGAYFSLLAYRGLPLSQSLFLSPVVDMERVIRNRMAAAGVSEERLRAEKHIPVEGGPPLDWDYFDYVRTHPVRFAWESPTAILCGENDTLSGRAEIAAFARRYGAEVRVLPGGEHFFHTPEQLSAFDGWAARTLRE